MLSRLFRGGRIFSEGVIKGIGVGVGATVWDKHLKSRFFPVVTRGVEQLSAPKIKMEDIKINKPR